MKIKLDLHIHSKLSPDGCMSIDQIVSEAKARGLNGIAVCDHDRVNAALPEYDDFVLIPAVEVTTECGHLLGLFVSAPIETRSLEEASAAIRAQGGLSVIAHPFEHSNDEGRLDDVMDCLDAVEVWNGRADRKNHRANEMARELAKRFSKPVTAGSDAHVPAEIGNGIAVFEVESLSPASVRSAIVNGADFVEGRRGKASSVAKSQLAKRRVSGAGAASYVKWTLFAAKCCVQDIFTWEEKTYVFSGKDRQEGKEGT